ncbi:MAG TPA: TMEM175 family protein [Wenzhouxiangella sp.]|nr:TMEM175 family protein [Wenzhouxiangella sp.]
MSAAPVDNEKAVKRGRAMTRLDTFTDAAFAFAVTMLAISIDEVPGSYPELVAALKSAPAFIASFAILMLYWRAHQNWSERYGLDDLPSVLLTAALVMVVMIYVYPLRIIMGTAFSTLSAGWLPSRFPLESIEQYRALVSIFAVGFVAMSGLIAGLYLHAWRCQEQLAMGARERFDTAAEALAWSIVAAVGVLSLLLAWTLPDRWLAVPAWIYCVLIVYGWVFDWAQRRIARKRFG